MANATANRPDPQKARYKKPAGGRIGKRSAQGPLREHNGEKTYKPNRETGGA